MLVKLALFLGMHMIKYLCLDYIRDQRSLLVGAIRGHMSCLRKPMLS